MKNCTALAAALSANFLSTTPYTNSNASLSNYLSNNGILLTMCMDNFCAIPPQMDWISASWITNEIGASRIIPSGSVGLILDPLVSHVRCAYPTDAATLERDDGGCGAFVLDPKKGSRGYDKAGRVTRWLTKRALEAYSRTNFGDKPWQDIPCDSYFHINDFNNKAISWRRDCNIDETSAQHQYEYESVYSEVVYEYQPFLGHAPCALDNDTTGVHFDNSSWFLYSGECSWKPNEWQNMVNSMNQVLLKKGPVMTWNEVVLAKPARIESIVSAVFYLETKDEKVTKRARYLAAKEAALLGGKPVLSLDMNGGKHDKPLLSCVNDDKGIDNTIPPTDVDDELVWTGNIHSNFKPGLRGLLT